MNINHNLISHASPGIPDRLDQDTDGDGLSDKEEGIPDWRIPETDVDPKVPLDTDGDGILDVVEGDGDADGDGSCLCIDLAFAL